VDNEHWRRANGVRSSLRLIWAVIRSSLFCCCKQEKGLTVAVRPYDLASLSWYSSSEGGWQPQRQSPSHTTTADPARVAFEREIWPQGPVVKRSGSVRSSVRSGGSGKRDWSQGGKAKWQRSERSSARSNGRRAFHDTENQWSSKSTGSTDTHFNFNQQFLHSVPLLPPRILYPLKMKWSWSHGTFWLAIMNSQPLHPAQSAPLLQEAEAILCTIFSSCLHICGGGPRPSSVHVWTRWPLQHMMQARPRSDAGALRLGALVHPLFPDLSATLPISKHLCCFDCDLLLLVGSEIDAKCVGLGKVSQNRNLPRHYQRLGVVSGSRMMIASQHVAFSQPLHESTSRRAFVQGLWECWHGQDWLHAVPVPFQTWGPFWYRGHCANPSEMHISAPFWGCRQRHADSRIDGD